MKDTRDCAEVLIVDDASENLELLSEILAAAGYQVAAATSGERALKRLHQALPNLVLLDVCMPGIDGFETCRRIKANPQTAHLPIIFITALTDGDTIAKGFALGAVDYISKPIRDIELLSRVKNHLELQRLRQSLELQVAKRTQDLERAMTCLQATLDQLQETQTRMLQSEKMATHDPLTELPNRRLLMDRLEQAMASAHRHQQTLGLIFLDLDGFKRVNDTYNHQVGDALLVQVTQVLQARLRRQDGLFRLGGDEFVILVEQVESADSVLTLVKRLLAELCRPFSIQGHTITVGGSFGIKLYSSTDRQTLHGVLADADNAMYRAKTLGNSIALHGNTRLYTAG